MIRVGAGRRTSRLICACLLVGFGSIYYIGLPTAWMRRGVVHVAPWGSDLLIGHSPSWALRTLGRAVLLASPGETILLWPGTYPETILLRRGGLPGRPLRIRAAIPGQAVISGAAPPWLTSRWHWRQRGLRVFTTATATPVQALRVGSLEAFQALSLPEFQALCARSGAWPLFYFSQGVGVFRNGTLWVCLPDGRPPHHHRITVHRPMEGRSRAGGHQTATLWIQGSHVEISHLHFDFGVGAAIQLWDASEVALHDNLFTGVDVGINSNPSLRPPRRVLVDRNAYHHAPQEHWRRWLTWHELYRNSNSSLLWLHGGDHTIRRNLVYQSGDAFKLTTQSGHMHVHENLIVGSSDDAIELDGSRAPIGISSNLVVNSFVGVSATPLPSGPVALNRNLFLNGLRNGHNAWLKLLQGPIAALRLRNNLFIGQWVGWYRGGAPGERLDSRANHLYASHRFGPHPGPDAALQQDRFVHLSQNRWPDPADGPSGLPGVPHHRLLDLSVLGPCWLNLAEMRPFRELSPLLRSGWLHRPPLRFRASCARW